MAATLDVLGYLPGPPTRYNCGAADTLASETFAYGVASSIAVLDVRRPFSPLALALDDAPMESCRVLGQCLWTYPAFGAESERSPRLSQ